MKVSHSHSVSLRGDSEEEDNWIRHVHEIPVLVGDTHIHDFIHPHTGIGLRNTEVQC